MHIPPFELAQLHGRRLTAGSAACTPRAICHQSFIASFVYVCITRAAPVLVLLYAC
jgi:hypothetical protein